MKTHLSLLLSLAALTAAAQTKIDLAGEWRFAQGEQPNYTEIITLPGSMLTNGKGDDVTTETQWIGSLYDSSYYFNPHMARYREPGQMKLPFFLTPDKHYVGNAWYSKSVSIPKDWKRRRVVLSLERPHIETTVFVNGSQAGRDSSLSVPHEFDITNFIMPGKENTIEIKVYNGIENVCVGQDSHSVTDQTQGNWNGIAGQIVLLSRPKEYIENVQVFPHLTDKTISVRLQLVSTEKQSEMAFSLNGTDYERHRLTPDSTGTVDLTLSVGDDVRLWDEFEPNLYTLTSVLGEDTVRTTFGMREISIEGRQFFVNGRPTWMRGTVENCCFPLTGYPPTDVESWKQIFEKCKEYGLNLMRFHSYCPPEEAFVAADEVGFYLQPEGPSWPNHGVLLGNGMSIDRYLLEETQRMTAKYGNHPSFCMLAAGNEPAGEWVQWVSEFVDYWRQTGDTRRVYCGASVGGGWAWDPRSEYHVKGGARGLDWSTRPPQSVDDYYKAITSFTQGGSKPTTFEINEPFLSHEQGQWCAFPDLKETSQYTGVYKARNFEIFRDLLSDNGMEERAEKFLMASGHLQTLAYKYEIERNLRTPEYAGFQLLGLNDYSGQGTALVGVLNVFWQEKGYCTARDWTQFCSPVVPLARFPKFVYTSADTLSVEVEMYNAYREPLRNARTTFSICDSEGKEIFGGQLSQCDIALGKNIPLGTLSLPLTIFDAPQKLTLTVTTTPQKSIGQRIENQWDFWVYPQEVAMPDADEILITDTLDEKACDVLRKGGKVLIAAAGKVRFGNDVKQTYLPVFWNTSWFKMRPPHTTGASIDTAHPLFRHFPTDDWANLNWWELLNRAQVMNLSQFPADYQPPIQPIDTWHVSRKLGMLVEANVLGGRLLVTTMDIDSNLSNRVVARQMRKALIEYMKGEEFRPALTIEPQVITNLFENEAPKVDMFTNDSPDELKPKLK